MALSNKARFLLKAALGSPEIATEVADVIDEASEIGTSEIAANAVTYPKIASNSVSLRHMQPVSVNTGALGLNAVDSAQLSYGSLDVGHYAAASINVGAMAVNSVDSAQYADKSIDQEHYAVGSVNLAALNADVSPAYVVKYAGSVVLTETNQENTVSGALGTDIVILTAANVHPNVIVSGYTDTNKIAVNTVVDPGAVDARVNYQILRATS